MAILDGLSSAPTRKTSEGDLNSWNIALRQSPAYQKFLESIGQGHGRATSLSRGQQSQLEQMLASSGVPVPSGMHIDQAGNLNQKNRLVRNVAITVGLSAAALATAGAAGFGPLAGAMSGGGGAASAGGAAGVGMAGGGTTAGIAGGALPGVATAIPTMGAAAGGGAAMTGAGILGKAVGYYSKAAPILKAVSPILGKAAAARQQAKSEEELMQQRRDQLNLQSAEAHDRSILDRANLDLNQRKFATTAPGERLSTGIRGSIAGNAHNVTVGSGAPMTLSSGRSISPIHFDGLGPDDLLSPDARSLGDQVTHDMLLQEMAGDKFAAPESVDFPTATAAPKSGIVDKLLGTGAFVASLGAGASAGAGGGILSGMQAALKRKQTIPYVGDAGYPDPNGGVNA